MYRKEAFLPRGFKVFNILGLMRLKIKQLNYWNLLKLWTNHFSLPMSLKVFLSLKKAAFAGIKKKKIHWNQFSCLYYWFNLAKGLRIIKTFLCQILIIKEKQGSNVWHELSLGFIQRRFFQSVRDLLLFIWSTVT